MVPLNTHDMGRDHKHWLAELERWQGYSRLWAEQQKNASEDVTRVLKEHEQRLAQHVESLDGLMHTIADCERAISKGSSSSEILHNQHEMDSRLHSEQRVEHERLKAAHHRLMMALAMLKGEPFRED